ncbi:MAG TPA: HAD family hydrolase [Acidimicrobiales bacterium]|nr:HAD family hydrolase [Acidimicrobiales bacterium]
MARAAIFDFYGTLAHAVRWGPSPADVFARLGHRLDDAAYAAWRAEVFDGMEHLAHSQTRELYLAWERDRLRRLATACGVGPENLEELAAELHHAMQDFELTAYDEVPEVLAELRRRGLVVAVCSNWTWDLDLALDQCALSGAADVVVTSAQAGVRKPHPRIFTLTLERCGVEPGDAVFVGDTWYPDVEGALAAGLRPVHVWRPEEAADADPAPLPAGVERVTDLGGVLDLVDP